MTIELPQYGLKAYALLFAKHGTNRLFRQSELDWIVSSSMKKKIFSLLLRYGWINKHPSGEYSCTSPVDAIRGLMGFRVPKILIDSKKPYAFTKNSAIELWSDYSYTLRGIEKSPYFIKVLEKDLKYWKEFWSRNEIPNYVGFGSTIGEYIILIPVKSLTFADLEGLKVDKLSETMKYAKSNDVYEYASEYMRKKYGRNMMNANLFSIREQEIFNILKQIKECDFVLIGGYAVNAYTLPRFSTDCDIVVKDSNELNKIAKILINAGYKKHNPKGEFAYSGKFFRYEKIIEKNFSVSIDILVGYVSDRMTGVIFSTEWIFKHPILGRLNGKTIIRELQLKILGIDALIVMKIISCRATDIRDVFMMLPKAKDSEWIKKEVGSRYNLNDRITKIFLKINSKQFKDGLSGVYGNIDNTLFEKHKKTVEKYL